MGKRMEFNSADGDSATTPTPSATSTSTSTTDSTFMSNITSHLSVLVAGIVIGYGICYFMNKKK